MKAIKFNMGVSSCHLVRALEFIGTLREADIQSIISYLDHVASKRTNANDWQKSARK
jgi:hypothetical protein